MLTLIMLEFRKLFGARSARLAALICVLLPWIWPLAPRLKGVYNLVIVSGWQVPTLSLITITQFLLPLLVALTCAEMIGTEISQGTLAPLMLRPINRSRIIVAKLITALIYPALLLAVLFVASLVAGLRFGFGDFSGGTGLGPGLFVGVGQLSSGEAFGQVLRSFLLDALALMPIAALSLLYAVAFLNTAAAALATLATIQIMNMLVVFPEALQKILITTYLDLYSRQGDLTQPIILMVIYTVGFSLLAVFAFEKRDL
ncbi:ABC transporter permease [Deinococcus rubellus]|uniref:ABC transporter permease n=1 Tax=Deinococcus rubellus TaxID=1889240 RepID=A0ABY5YFL9_9DEIO|nr:ABC transporter permease [Deinococcus rubellus]UWX63843.1 ABC transporter permease [Deinococcus rubellus]